jgi:hypothetical protein
LQPPPPPPPHPQRYPYKNIYLVSFRFRVYVKCEAPSSRVELVCVRIIHKACVSHWQCFYKSTTTTISNSLTLLGGVRRHYYNIEIFWRKVGDNHCMLFCFLQFLIGAIIQKWAPNLLQTSFASGFKVLIEWTRSFTNEHSYWSYRVSLYNNFTIISQAPCYEYGSNTVILGSSLWFTNLERKWVVHGIKDNKQTTFCCFVCLEMENFFHSNS